MGYPQARNACVPVSVSQQDRAERALPVARGLDPTRSGPPDVRPDGATCSATQAVTLMGLHGLARRPSPSQRTT